MQTISNQRPINLKVVRFELNFIPPTADSYKPKKVPKVIQIPEPKIRRKKQVPAPPIIPNIQQTRSVEDLIEELLDKLYSDQRDWGGSKAGYGHRSSTVESLTSLVSTHERTEAIERSFLEGLELSDLHGMVGNCMRRMREESERLARQLRARDRLRRQQKRLNGGLSVLLRYATSHSPTRGHDGVTPVKSAPETIADIGQRSFLASFLAPFMARNIECGDSSAKFSVSPTVGGEGGYAQWLHAMRLVARLPSGVPQHFRKKLWLTLAERHLSVRGVDWPAAERASFRGTAQPEDTELGAQIVKDLHRTGCSLFCGVEGRENQAMLRRVLLAYARWNKEVGYCQGFNMLAAIILEVMEKSESDSLKVMIYLVEAVLPEGYFADDLRGLSADMAAFRDLLKIRLPRLAQHMDRLQKASDGGGVEPPLPDVFTMQWFLTLYATWLPRGALLRVWDLVFLDGNEVLLLTALGIWDLLQDRILSARSADEFYSCMGGGAGVVYEAGDALVARVIALGAAPELPRLRDMHRYHVTPPVPPAPPPASTAAPVHSAVQSVTRRGLKLFYSEDEGDSSDEGNKMALATVNVPLREEISGGDRLSLDIGALKRQYARLRERQRQAHVILAAACARHAAAVGVPTTPTSLTVNHLLLGKSAIVSSRGRRLGPPPGAIPPSRRSGPTRTTRGHSRSSDTISWKDEHNKRNITRRDSIKWKDIKAKKNIDPNRRSSIDDDETGDGVIVSEREADEMMSSMRSRSMSESSSYSSRSASSTDTSLCDDNNRASDFDSEPQSFDDYAVLDSNNASDLLIIPDEETDKSLMINESNQAKNDIMYNKDSNLVLPFSKEEMINVDVPTLSDFVSSTPGEQLRNYLEEFENRKNTLQHVSETPELLKKSFESLPFQAEEAVSKLTREVASKSDGDILALRCSVKKDLTKTPEFHKSPSCYDKGIISISPDKNTAINNFEYKSIYSDSYRLTDILADHSETMPFRPGSPDFIDHLIMSPNFVPDIDLSDNNLSDVESLHNSPDAESIVISEDEPPIPLTIDKYFEHSPEFFGARKVSGLRSSDGDEIPNRRTHKRLSRLPKKPDSLMLQHNLNETFLDKTDDCETSIEINKSNFNTDFETDRIIYSSVYHKDVIYSVKKDIYLDNSERNKEEKESETRIPEDKANNLESGRRNSERALEIIQENSKILNRILTKQSAATSLNNDCEISNRNRADYHNYGKSSIIAAKIEESPILKGSASDSLIKWDELPKSSEFERDSKFLKLRPTSLDESLTPALQGNKSTIQNMSTSLFQNPSSGHVEDKTDIYGWENKVFLVKSEIYAEKKCKSETEVIPVTTSPIASSNSYPYGCTSAYDWSTPKGNDVDISDNIGKYDNQDFKRNLDPLRYQGKSFDLTSRDDTCDVSLSSKYSDCLLSKASDICSRTLDIGPKVCKNLSIVNSSQASDFTYAVTSSMSFSFEPSADDDSPTAAKSNSSDTLCQITSLDQISTPISPKVFSRESDILERSLISSDDTSSQITSLIETETVSSLSCPRSPSTGSYHPFPARPAIRKPKELGVRLGLYSRDSINYQSK